MTPSSSRQWNIAFSHDSVLMEREDFQRKNGILKSFCRQHRMVCVGEAVFCRGPREFFWFARNEWLNENLLVCNDCPFRKSGATEKSTVKTKISPFDRDDTDVKKSFRINTNWLLPARWLQTAESLFNIQAVDYLLINYYKKGRSKSCLRSLQIGLYGFIIKKCSYSSWWK